MPHVLSIIPRLNEFSDPFDCRVFCGTWNVCNKRHSNRDELRGLIFPRGQEPADIYSIGFQEIVDLNARNVVMDSSKSDERAKFLYMELQALIESTTGSKYTLILNGNLVGLCLGVFVKSTLLPFVSDARSATVGIGLMGVMGNKGAVTARFKVHDSSLCFVCCHLRAHREEVAGRNLDVKTISERTNYLPVEDSLFNAGIGQKASNVWRTDEFYSSLTIDQHDFIFWLGDMNYRVSKDLSTEEVFRMIDANNWRNLLHSDQLSQERKKGTVFNEFIEPDINFMPTYKYQPGTAVYERRPEKKLRAPAWCDRVLYKTKEPIDVLLYDSPTIEISDHMPVHGLFKIQGRKVNATKELEMYKSQLAMADTLENELAPKVELNDRMIVLDDLKYQV